jgi:hypothetical protein
VALANLDAVLLEARSAVEALPAHLLDELEGAVKAHLARGGAIGAAPPSLPGSPTRKASRPGGTPLRIGRPTAAPLDLGEAMLSSVHAMPCSFVSLGQVYKVRLPQPSADVCQPPPHLLIMSSVVI